MPTHEDVKKQATKDKILGAINESKCNWPHCPLQHEVEIGLPVVLRLPDGRMRPVADRGAKASFCVYHAQIARDCCGYGIKEAPSDENPNPEGNLMGPFEAIHMIEAVEKARKAWNEVHPGEQLPQVHLQEVPAKDDTPKQDQEEGS